MTEQRFTVDSDGKYWDRITQCYVTIDYLVDLANHLTEENEQLNDSLLSTSKELQYGVKKVQRLAKENEQLKKQIERIDFILDDLNGAEYISRDDGIKALNKIDKVIGKR